MCSKCQLSKEEIEYHKKANGKLYSQCKSCHAEYRKSHYHNNKQYYIDKAVKWKEAYQEWFYEIKSKLKCELCGEDHLACLDFHHDDPNNKEMGVSYLLQRCASKEKILNEIEKCKVACANCHRKLHWKRSMSDGCGGCTAVYETARRGS